MNAKYYIKIACAVFVIYGCSFGKEILVHGIVMEDEAAQASLRVDGKPSKWLQVSQTIEGYTLTSIDPTKGTVELLTPEGILQSVSMTKAISAPQDGAPTPQLLALNQLNWSWIKSEDNPMRHMREVLPDWAGMNWKTLSEETKISLRNYYRSHGWDITVTETPTGYHVRNTRLKDPNKPPPSPKDLAHRKESSVIASPIKNMNNEN